MLWKLNAKMHAKDACNVGEITNQSTLDVLK